MEQQIQKIKMVIKYGLNKQIGYSDQFNAILVSSQVIIIIAATISSIIAVITKDNRMLKLALSTLCPVVIFLYISLKKRYGLSALLTIYYFLVFEIIAFSTGIYGIKSEVILFLPVIYLLGNLFLSDVPIIIASGFSLKGDAAALLKEKSVKYLNKPYKISELENAVNSVFSNTLKISN